MQVLTCATGRESGEAAPPASKHRQVTLLQTIGQAAAALSIGPLSLVITGAEGPPDVRIDADRPLYPASMIKTPLAAVVWVLIKDGLIAADQTLRVTDSNMT